MKIVISEGDTVQVTKTVRGFYQGRYLATVLRWTSSGRLKVKLRENGMLKIVSPESVKKVADGPTCRQEA